MYEYIKKNTLVFRKPSLKQQVFQAHKFFFNNLKMAGCIPKLLKTVGKGVALDQVLEYGKKTYKETNLESICESIKVACSSKNPDEVEEQLKKALENSGNIKNECPSAKTLYERISQTYCEMKDQKNDNSNKNAEYLGFEDLYDLLEEVATDLELLHVLQKIFPKDLLKN